MIAILKLTLAITTNEKLKKFSQMTEAELWAEFNSIMKDREADKDAN